MFSSVDAAVDAGTFSKMQVRNRISCNPYSSFFFSATRAVVQFSDGQPHICIFLKSALLRVVSLTVVVMSAQQLCGILGICTAVVSDVPFLSIAK